MNELSSSEVREFFRPNFWPNTPDILPEHLQYGGRPAFIARLVLAATLSSNYGIYGPAFELIENDAISGKEEYLNSEKYEIKIRDLNKPGNIKDIIKKVNTIRKENASLQTTWNVSFHKVDHDQLLFYVKVSEDLSNIIFVVVNLDPFQSHSGTLQIPIKDLGIDPDQPYLVHELLSDSKFIWQGQYKAVKLDPNENPAKIFRLHRRLRREQDFDYFM